jgi:hypothetical protein
MRHPSRIASPFAALLLAVIAGIPAQAATREEIREQFKTIAVMPMVAPADTPNAEQAERRMEQLMEQRLAEAGYTVVPAATMRELQDKIRTALGGYYDPRTGDLDQKRLETWDAHVTSEFRRLHPSDAWLHSRIMFLRAPIAGWNAVWNGVEESVIGAESNAEHMFNIPDVTGGLSALSLQVALGNQGGETLYSGSGGLQLLEYLQEVSAGATLLGVGGSSTRYVPVDDAAVLTDPLREQRAVAIALDPLLLTKEERKAAEAAQQAAWKQIKPAPKGHQPPKPAPVDRAVFLESYKRVAVALPQMPDIPNRAAARERVIAALTAALTQAGFTVVPPATYAAAWDPIYEAAGGFYDPMTGKLLTEKRSAALRAAFEKLGADTPVDVVFLPEVVMRPARLDKGEARWDGAVVQLSKGGLFSTASGFGGTVPALSLELRAVDREMKEVFLRRGGIELLVRFKPGGFMKPATFEDIPEADWLSKPANDGAAVERTLSELMPPK